MADANIPNKFPIHSAAEAGDAVYIPWDRFEGFVNQFTHDVRNGLNALELQLTFLGEISTDPEAVEEVKHLRGSLSAITRQLQAVKSATGPIHPNVLDYPSDDLFEDLRERLTRLQPETAKKVAWTLSDEPAVTMLIDPDLTISGLIELFTNAARFGSSSIHCTTANREQTVLFTLRENPAAAPIMPAEQWGRAPLVSSRRGAYGLGLFRVNRIMEAQGATLRATYSAEENLLTTTVTLPRPAAVVAR